MIKQINKISAKNLEIGKTYRTTAKILTNQYCPGIKQSMVFYYDIKGAQKHSIPLFDYDAIDYYKKYDITISDIYKVPLETTIDISIIDKFTTEYTIQSVWFDLDTEINTARKEDAKYIRYFIKKFIVVNSIFSFQKNNKKIQVPFILFDDFNMAIDVNLKTNKLKIKNHKGKKIKNINLDKYLKQNSLLLIEGCLNHTDLISGIYKTFSLGKNLAYILPYKHNEDSFPNEIKKPLRNIITFINENKQLNEIITMLENI
ncbi:MAG: hypothetical protein QXO21_00010 [Candidatus Anstonellales archaeon]